MNASSASGLIASLKSVRCTRKIRGVLGNGVRFETADGRYDGVIFWIWNATAVLATFERLCWPVDGGHPAPPLEHPNGLASPIDSRLVPPHLRCSRVRAIASRWQHRIVAIDRAGRISLPTEARAVVDLGPEVRGASRDLMLVLRPGGPGTRVELDSRGRLLLPTWLRDTASSNGTVLVAIRGIELVIVAPTSLLDEFSDDLEGRAS